KRVPIPDRSDQLIMLLQDTAKPLEDKGMIVCQQDAWFRHGALLDPMEHPPGSLCRAWVLTLPPTFPLPCVHYPSYSATPSVRSSDLRAWRQIRRRCHGLIG